MAKKRLKRQIAKREVSDASRSFTKFLRVRVKELREEFASLTKNPVKRGKEFLKEESHFSVMGFVWPLISAAWGIMVLLLTVIMLNVINMSLQNYYVASLSVFFYNNLYLFFGISVFFGYADYLKSRFPQFYRIVAPIIGSMSVVSVGWLFSMALNIVNPYHPNNPFMIMASVIYLNLDKIFLIFLVLGYFLMISNILIKKHIIKLHKRK